MSFLQARSQESSTKSEGVSLNVGVGEVEVNQTTALKQRNDCFSYLKEERVLGNSKES